MKLKFQRNYQPDNEYIRLHLAQQNIQWAFNPSLASHFGQFWERLTQTAKRSLLIVLGSQKLRLSVLKTAEAEAAAFLNSRSLTHVGFSISDEGPLTSIHFRLSRPHICSKLLMEKNQRFSTKDLKLKQKLPDYYRSRLIKEYILISTSKRRGKNQMMSWMKMTLYACSSSQHPEASGLMKRL